MSLPEDASTSIVYPSCFHLLDSARSVASLALKVESIMQNAIGLKESVICCNVESAKTRERIIWGVHKEKTLRAARKIG